MGRVVPGPPTVWVAGLTADLPRCRPRVRACGGERGDEGVPPCGGPLSPCRQQVVWGAAAPKEYPVWGASGHLTISNVYWMILDALSHHIPRQGRPPGLSGGCASRGEWRGVQGSPGGEGAERDSPDTPSHRIPGPIGMEK
jgi:hypothetical protein